MRKLVDIVEGIPATDGAGVKLSRMIGTDACDMIDPFLMLDRFDSDDPDAYIAGFPDHPHRGFETVTIMLDGLMRHRDSVGNNGVLGPGDVQWMTAGSGIIHSEMPEMIEGRMRGFQLWVNLPAKDKMTPPRYQDIPAEKIVKAQTSFGHVRIIAGDFQGQQGPAQSRTGVRIFDATVNPGAEFSVDPADGSNHFLCVYDGEINAPTDSGSGLVSSPAIALFEGDGPITVTAGTNGASILYCEGAPLNEPVSRAGPFVMNTRAEIEQAILDYNRGTLTEH